MDNKHNPDANTWKRRFIYSLALILGLAVTALGAPDYFDREPINTAFAANKPVIGGATYDDIRQGEAPTCALLASLSAAARSGIDLSKNIKHLGGNNYSVKLFVNNNWSDIKVGFKGWTEYDPIPNDEGEFWVALFQRAYLSALNVDCSDADGNKWAEVKDGKKTDPDKDAQHWLRTYIALTTVTGQETELWNLNQADAAATIKRIREALQKKRCVVMATKGRRDNDLVADKICLVESHAYTVTAAGADWIEVRNPWGRDIPRSLLLCKSWKNGKEIYAFKEGYSDGRDNDPNDGIVRVGLDSLKFFINAAVTKEDAAAKLRKPGWDSIEAIMPGVLPKVKHE